MKYFRLFLRLSRRMLEQYLRTDCDTLLPLPQSTSWAYITFPVITSGSKGILQLDKYLRKYYLLHCAGYSFKS